MNERTHPVGGPTVRWAFGALLVLCVILGPAVEAGAAPELRLEAEEFEAYGSYNAGGSEIATAYCSYASGFLAVDGLDFPGDWFKLKVTFTQAGCYGSRIDYQSAYGDTAVLRVRILDCPTIGEELIADYTLDQGMGYG